VGGAAAGVRGAEGVEETRGTVLLPLQPYPKQKKQCTKRQRRAVPVPVMRTAALTGPGGGLVAAPGEVGEAGEAEDTTQLQLQTAAAAAADLAKQPKKFRKTHRVIPLRTDR
jgi:hypothetical protein